MEKEGQQLDQVIVDVAILLLNTDDVWRVERLGPVQLQVLIERKKPKLEEVFDHNGNL